MELAKESAYTPSELSAYEVYWDSVRTERTLLQGRYDEGRAEGRVEGRAEERIAMARELKKQGIAFSIIEQVTSLSREKIEEL